MLLLSILYFFPPESQENLLPGRLEDSRNVFKPACPPCTQWGDPTLTSSLRSLVTAAPGIYLFKLIRASGQEPGVSSGQFKASRTAQEGYCENPQAQCQEKPLPPTIPAPMCLLLIPLAPRSSEKKVTPNPGGFSFPVTSWGLTRGQQQQAAQRSNPTPHPPGQKPSPPEERELVPVPCAVPPPASAPRMLPLPRVTLSFNVPETMDWCAVQQGLYILYIFTHGV